MPDDMTDEDLSDLEHHRRGMADIVAHGSVPWEQVKLGPLATHTLTTDALPREGEGQNLLAAMIEGSCAANDRLRERLAAEMSISNGLSTACCKLKIELATLRAELAKRDETIVKALPTVAEIVAEHDAELNGALGRLVAHADKATIATLRTQLARAGAIEEAARETVEGWDDHDTNGTVFGFIVANLRRTLTPYPVPRGTPEGEPAAKAAEVDFPPPGPGTICYPANGSPAPESLWAVVTTEDKARLAILERVATACREYVADREGAWTRPMRLALADLDATEVQP